MNSPYLTSSERVNVESPGCVIKLNGALCPAKHTQYAGAQGLKLAAPEIAVGRRQS